MTRWSVLGHVPEAGGVRELLARAASAAADDDPMNSGMTHSWLFTGPPGSGRSEAATAFAAALIGMDRADLEADGPGRWKSRVAAHPDVLRVRTEGAEIRVTVARTQVIPFAYRRPTTAPWRVVLIEEADRLNPESANALLKVVEEPPARTVFLMCAPSTNPEDFSVTLRSRCRHVYVPVPGVADVATLLREGDPELTAEQAEWAATVSNCHIGRARKLADPDASSRHWREQALQLAEGVFDPQVSYQRAWAMATAANDQAAHELEPVETRELAKLEESLGVGAKGRGAASATRGARGQVKELEKEQARRRKRYARDLIDLALMDVMGLFRDALRESLGADGRAITVDRSRTIAELVRRVPPEQLIVCFDAVLETRHRLDTNIGVEPLLEGLIGQLQIACRVGVR